MDPEPMGPANLKGFGGYMLKNALKTHCVRGHEFNTVNTVRGPSGERVCVLCRRLRFKKWNDKQKCLKPS